MLPLGGPFGLVLMNTCGAIPGLFDRSCLGHPGKYAYCIGENEQDSPWLPLHVERAAAGTSAVTAFACEGPRQVRNGLSQTPEGVLTTIADVMSSLGTSLTTSGSVASTSTGTRQEKSLLSLPGSADHLQAWLVEERCTALSGRAGRRTVADLKRGVAWPGRLPRAMSTYIPVVERPDDIMIVAAGGEEGAMSVIPSWGPKVSSTAVTWPAIYRAQGAKHMATENIQKLVLIKPVNEAIPEQSSYAPRPTGLEGKRWSAR